MKITKEQLREDKMKNKCGHKHIVMACRQIEDKIFGSYCNDCCSYLDNDKNPTYFPDRSYDPRGNILDRVYSR